MQLTEQPPLWIGRTALILGALIALYPGTSSAASLLLGVFVALVLGNPYAETTRPLTRRLLALSVMGLGGGMDLAVIGRVGLHGIGYTLGGIGSAFLMGWGLRRALRVERDISLLITVGTAICGGSAIAAVAPVIRAKDHEVSVALGTVFVLNAVALVVFPIIGHRLGLDEARFGLWAALAIHDTSSVVGATLGYGAHALQVGTTVKLARALWIAPIALAIGWARGRSQGDSKRTTARVPGFILGFVLIAALVTWVPALRDFGHYLSVVAQRGLVLTLFLIGANLTRSTLRAVGFRPFIQGLSLWLLMASLSLAMILTGWIS